jgi:REP-associated tyrosine transposase
MLEPNEEGCERIKLMGKETHLQVLSKTIGKTLSSYTQALNIERKTTGNLFQKKTKAKCLTEQLIIDPRFVPNDYLVNCFLYIHNNPLKANIISNLKDWPYSSWPDYYKQKLDSICNINKARMKIDFAKVNFKNSIFQNPDDEIIDLLF